MKFEKCLKEAKKFIDERNKSKYEQNHLDYVAIHYDSRIVGWLKKDGQIVDMSTNFNYYAFVLSDLWDYGIM